jgi:beta-1,2-mannobiose phosphorylase / 1,2-beta-oligomannan phosphorylase
MKRFSAVFLFAVCTLLAVTAANAQTTWFKYEGNPVLKAGSSSAWDGYAVTPGRVLLEDSVYQMWYSGFGNGKLRVGRATSLDGVTWTKDARNPVLSEGPPSSWENVGIRDVYVVHTTAGYKMWYTGDQGTSYPWLYGIGYASSPDGIAWMKTDSANPVLKQASSYTRGPNTPSVLGPDSVGGYKMWFTGEPLAHQQFQILYGTALDETTWTPLVNPVFPYGIPGSWDDDKVFCPRVLYDGEKYEMFYCGERALDVDPKTQIGYATSVDGLSWTRSSLNPVLKRGPGWEFGDLYGVEILLDKGMYNMWYGGSTGTGTNDWRVGYAVSPKGFSCSPPENSHFGSRDTVLIKVHIDIPDHRLSFVADIDEAYGGPHMDTLRLFDDGRHDDSLSGDGLYANRWHALYDATYLVKMSLILNDTVRFSKPENVTYFTVPVAETKLHFRQDLRWSRTIPILSIP